MTRRHRPERPSTTSRSCLLAAQENNVIKRYSPFLPKSACQGKHGGAPSRGSFGKFKSNLVPPHPVPLPPCTPAPAAAIFGVRGGAASQVTQPSPAQPSPAQPSPASRETVISFGGPVTSLTTNRGNGALNQIVTNYLENEIIYRQ